MYGAKLCIIPNFPTLNKQLLPSVVSMLSIETSLISTTKYSR